MLAQFGCFRSKCDDLGTFRPDFLFFVSFGSMLAQFRFNWSQCDYLGPFRPDFQFSDCCASGVARPEIYALRAVCLGGVGEVCRTGRTGEPTGALAGRLGGSPQGGPAAVLLGRPTGAIRERSIQGAPQGPTQGLYRDPYREPCRGTCYGPYGAAIGGRLLIHQPPASTILLVAGVSIQHIVHGCFEHLRFNAVCCSFC